VEFVIYIDELGGTPPATYVAQQVTFLDAVLAAVRASDQAFPWMLRVKQPRGGVLTYAGVEYVAVVLPVEYTEVL
jgi:hypothetical protein